MVRSSSTSGLNSRSSLYDAANNFAHNTANYTRQTVTSALHQHARRGDHVKRMIAAHAIHSDVLCHLHQLAAPDCSLCKPIPGDDACSTKLNRWCMDEDPVRKVNEANRYKDNITLGVPVDERPIERPPFLVRHFNDWTPSSRWPGLPDKLKVDGRKSPTRARPIKVTHGNLEKLGSGRVSRFGDYKGDFKHRSHADGDELNSYQSEYSSRFPDDLTSSRLSCADPYESASGRLSRRSASTSGLYDFESLASNTELTRPRRPSRTRDVPSLNVSRRTSSIADLLDTQNSSDAISERVRRALLRDSAHEKHLVHLISKYDDERRSHGSLEKLEVDLLRSNR